MLFVDLKKYPLRTLDGLAEVAKKYKRFAHTPGPLLQWKRLYDKSEVKTSSSAPEGPALALIALGLGLLRLAQDSFEQTPGDITFAQYVYQHIERVGVETPSALSAEEQAFVDGIRGRAIDALGLGSKPSGKRTKG